LPSINTIIIPIRHDILNYTRLKKEETSL